MARELGPKRHILANMDEPKAGDYSYGLYDKAHPVHGDPDTIARIKKELRGLRGRDVRVIIRGARIDEDGKARRFTASREITLNRYSDLFGPGSAYGSVMHAVRERHSGDTLVTYEITLEEAK